MTIPLIILAILSLTGGFLNIPSLLGGHQSLAQWFNKIPSLSSLSAVHHEISHSTEILLMSLAVALVFVILVFMYLKMKSNQFTPSLNSRKGLAFWGENKFYVDELYQWLVIRPVEALSDIFYMYIEPYLIQPLFSSSSKLSYGLGNIFRKVQNGNIEYYLLYITLGLIAFITLVLFKI